MARPLILALAAYYGVNGAYLLLFSGHFYETVPGVTQTGPFNHHFIVDIGFAFLVSAAALGWGAYKRIAPLAVFGGGWPVLHGLYHLQIWLAAGLPLNRVALADWAGVIVPALLLPLAAIWLRKAVPA